MEKFLWEGREKSLPCWLYQFSFANWKMQRKTWYVFHFGGGRHASFPQKPVVKEHNNYSNQSINVWAEFFFR